MTAFMQKIQNSILKSQKWFHHWNRNPYSRFVNIGILIVFLGVILLASLTPNILKVSASNVVYVNKDTGTDEGGCGGVGNPCVSIQYAITNIALDGDTIAVAAAGSAYDEAIVLGTWQGTLDGDYDADNTYADLTDTSGSGIGVISVSGGQTSSTVIKRFDLSFTEGGLNTGIYLPDTASTPTIQQMNISGFQTGIAANTVSDNALIITQSTFSGSTMYDVSSENGVKLFVNGNVFNGSLVTRGGNITAVNNIFKNDGVGGSGYIIESDAVATFTAVIANNTFYTTVLDIRDETEGGTTTAYVKNNIFDGLSSGSSSITMTETGDSITLYSDYNFFDSDAYAVTFTDGTGPHSQPFANWRQTLRSPDQNSVSAASAGFTTPGSDFTLSTSSAAIGVGTVNIVGTDDLATYSLDTDKAGSVRPLSGTVVDMGAYESNVSDFVSLVIAADPTTLSGETTTTQFTATYTLSPGGATDVTGSATWTSGDETYVTVSSAGLATGMGTGSANITATYLGRTSNTVAITTSGLAYSSVYVDATNGNDATGDGSQENPYKTLPTAMIALTGSGTMYLKGNFTISDYLYVPASGTVNARTTITNWPGETPVITYSGASGIIVDEADYVTISGLTINANGNTGIEYKNTDYFTVDGCTIYGGSMGVSAGFSNTQTNTVISNNTIYDNTQTDNGGIGIAIIGTNTGTEIYNNVIYDNNGNSFGFGILFVGTADDTDVWNNTIVGHKSTAIGTQNIGWGVPTITNLTVKNNVFSQTASGYGAALYLDAGTDYTADYNVYYVQNSVPIATVGATDYSTLAAWKTASGGDANSVSSDPLFTDVSGDDYTLGSGSPAINVGTSTGKPSGLTTDRAGTSRTNTYDLGAYESATSELTAIVIASSEADLDSTTTTSQLTATGSYAGEDDQTITSSVIWSSGDETVAEVDSDGLVTRGTTSGTSVITASLLGITSNEVEITNTVAATGGSSRPSRQVAPASTTDITTTTEPTAPTANVYTSIDEDFDTPANTIPKDTEMEVQHFNATAAIKISLGNNKDDVLVGKINQLLTGQINIKNKALVQTQLRRLIKSGNIKNIAGILNNPNVKAGLLKLSNTTILNKLLTGHRSDRLTLEIWEAGNRQNKVGTVMISTDLFGEGVVDLPDLPQNNYDFTIKKPFGLRKSINNKHLEHSMVLDFTNGGLYVGDLNKDGVIDLTDLQLLSSTFKELHNNPKDYDFNEDGILDLVDFSELLKSWSKTD